MRDELQTGIPAQPYWLAEHTGGKQLLASKERCTGKHFFPPIKPSSPLAGQYEVVVLSSSATLYSFTIIHPNKKSGKPPFALAYADFPENVRVFGVLEMPSDVRPLIGQDLAVTFWEDEAGATHYSFKPLA
jgi:uncharacterized protein